MSIDWAQVYASSYEDVVRFLYRKVWNADRAQDLAQETFVRCLRDARERSIANVRAFVFTVAANLARDEARTVLRRRRHLVLLKGDAEANRPEQTDVTEQLERERKVAAVEAALAELNERDREILLLWDAGLAYPDIAQHTGLAVGAIGTTLSRARRRLVDAYEEIERQKHAAHR